VKRLLPRRWLARILVWTFVDRIQRTELALEDTEALQQRHPNALPSERFKRHQRITRLRVRLSRLNVELRECPDDVQQAVFARLTR
jgi:hypothetical protein